MGGGQRSARSHDEKQDVGEGNALGDAGDGSPLDAANDADGRGRCANVDDCPAVANPLQDDSPGDLMGDACECAGVPALPDEGSLRASDHRDFSWTAPPGAFYYLVGCANDCTAAASAMGRDSFGILRPDPGCP